MILVGNGPTITRDPDNPFFENGAVLIKDKLIARVVPDADLRREFPDARYIDARGGLILPGFINAHMHYYCAFSRGFGGKGGAVSENF
ncbi:MAG: chlorohydrolase, partial [Planctomycetes bacterium]|nr:chlorohydrolase [Planctomycetota bacterium]